jgi:hypothetical protein
MRRRSSFPGFFNASTLWEIREGVSYPYLRGIGDHIPMANEEITPVAMDAATLHASATGRQLYIGGLTPGARFTVYSIGGQSVFDGLATDSKQTVALPTEGVFIVVSGRQSVKVIQN